MTTHPAPPPEEWPSEFVSGLIAEFPALRPAYDEHIRGNGELLAHMFMGDVVRFIEARYVEPESHSTNMILIKRIMDHVGQRFETTSSWIKELIAASFVENMPYSHEAAADVVDLLPDNLKSELAIQRG